MKNILLILMICLAPGITGAQLDTIKSSPDSITNQQYDTGLENGEAGGIDATETDTDLPLTLRDNWLYLVLAALIIAILSAAITRALSSKKDTGIAYPEPEQETPRTATVNKEPKTSIAEVKKLKQELKALQALYAERQTAYSSLEKTMTTQRNFDAGYFSEAFRKLVVPMNEALEKGSRKEITENMLRLTIHFTSLTRYKISKKQPYDETNIHFLLNQKGNNDAMVAEINGTTPIDKIPKNIKTIVDMLKEQGSPGLDDAILAGYKIRNL